jgi:hypothetical protein
MRNKVLQKWFVQNKEQLFHLSNDDIYVPTLTMNAVCMLQTFQQRLLKGKATMDYLVDYYYVLSKLKGDFQTFKDNVYVEKVFMGVRPCVVALILAPCFGMAKKAKLTKFNCWIPIVTALLIVAFGVSPIWCILVAGVGGFVWGRVKK